MENLGIDLKLLIAQLINFVLFFFIIKKFVAKPFLKFINDEKEKEKEKQKLLLSIEKQEKAAIEKEKAMQLKFKKELDVAIADAKEKATHVKEEIIKEAKEEAETIKKNAKAELMSEKEALYTEVKSKISELSLLIVNKALADSLDTEAKRKVTAKIVNNLPKNIDFYEN